MKTTRFSEEQMVKILREADKAPVSVWVKNLTDEEYRTYVFDTTAFFGAIENVPGQKRWFGGGFTYHW